MSFIIRVEVIAVYNSYRIIQLQPIFETQAASRITLENPGVLHLCTDTSRNLDRLSRLQHQADRGIKIIARRTCCRSSWPVSYTHLAGSAVGLGNIWRFPYLVAKYGGGTFLLCYIILAITFGFTLMVAEIALGRKTGLSAIGAFKKLDKRFGFLGVLAAVVPIIILPYYSVIGGWVIKYFATFVTGGTKAAAGDDYFTTFIGGVRSPILWFALFVVFTAVVVILGVEKGIEKMCIRDSVNTYH